MLSRALRALVSHVTRALCALAPYVPCALRALVPHVPHALRALTLRGRHTLHTLLLTTTICNLYRWNVITVVFFISDISLQDPLIYVNFTTSIH